MRCRIAATRGAEPKFVSAAFSSVDVPWLAAGRLLSVTAALKISAGALLCFTIAPCLQIRRRASRPCDGRCAAAAALLGPGGLHRLHGSLILNEVASLCGKVA
jgi:hypothetical protein